MEVHEYELLKNGCESTVAPKHVAVAVIVLIGKEALEHLLPAKFFGVPVKTDRVQALGIVGSEAALPIERTLIVDPTR